MVNDVAELLSLMLHLMISISTRRSVPDGVTTQAFVGSKSFDCTQSTGACLVGRDSSCPPLAGTESPPAIKAQEAA
jgi:hypothetical protein